MKNENLVNGLQMNGISETNIELCLQLKELGEKLGFEMSDDKYENILKTSAQGLGRAK